MTLLELTLKRCHRPAVPAADCPGDREPELTDMQPRRSQRDRRPRETLTYDSLGHPTYRVVGLHANPLYVGCSRGMGFVMRR